MKSTAGQDGGCSRYTPNSSTTATALNNANSGRSSRWLDQIAYNYQLACRHSDGSNPDPRSRPGAYVDAVQRAYVPLSTRTPVPDHRILRFPKSRRLRFFMSHRTPSSILAASVLLWLTGCGGDAGAGGTPGGTPSPPIITLNPTSTLPASGATWVYEQHIVSSSDTTLNGESGPLTITYTGTNAYRGGQYYTLTYQSIAGPPFPTNYFQMAAGGSFSEFAGAFYNFPIVPGCLQGPQVEDVLSKPLNFNSPGTSTVTETIYQCGSSPQSQQASVSVHDGGTTIVTTSGGRFNAHVYTGVYDSFGGQTTYTNYVAADVIVERRVTFSGSQTTTGTSVTEYESGPLNVAFPGLSMLLAQSW